MEQHNSKSVQQIQCPCCQDVQSKVDSVQITVQVHSCSDCMKSQTPSKGRESGEILPISDNLNIDRLANAYSYVYFLDIWVNKTVGNHSFKPRIAVNNRQKIIDTVVLLI